MKIVEKHSASSCSFPICFRCVSLFLACNLRLIQQFNGRLRTRENQTAAGRVDFPSVRSFSFFILLRFPFFFSHGYSLSLSLSPLRKLLGLSVLPCLPAVRFARFVPTSATTRNPPTTVLVVAVPCLYPLDGKSMKHRVIYPAIQSTEFIHLILIDRQFESHKSGDRIAVSSSHVFIYRLRPKVFLPLSFLSLSLI